MSLPQAGYVCILEQNASGFTAWNGPYHWIPIPSATDIKTFMAIPFALCRLTAAFESTGPRVTWSHINRWTMSI
ncbi:hypothetical protein LTR13_011460 [Exophiala sideris]|nr:hypothetical protein LTR13_011460 [Exophiala sideris]